LQFKRRGQKEQFEDKLYSYQHERVLNTWPWLSSWPLHPAIVDIIKKEGQRANRQISKTQVQFIFSFVGVGVNCTL